MKREIELLEIIGELIGNCTETSLKLAWNCSEMTDLYRSEIVVEWS